MKIFNNLRSLENTLWKEKFGIEKPKPNWESYELLMSGEYFPSNNKKPLFTQKQIEIAQDLLYKVKECEKAGHKPEDGETLIYFNDFGFPQAYRFCKKCGTGYYEDLTPEETKEFEQVGFKVV